MLLDHWVYIIDMLKALSELTFRVRRGSYVESKERHANIAFPARQRMRDRTDTNMDNDSHCAADNMLWPINTAPTMLPDHTTHIKEIRSHHERLPTNTQASWFSRNSRAFGRAVVLSVVSMLLTSACSA
jgi:hypothetical protein